MSARPTIKEAVGISPNRTALARPARSRRFPKSRSSSPRKLAQEALHGQELPPHACRRKTKARHRTRDLAPQLEARPSAKEEPFPKTCSLQPDRSRSNNHARE